MLGSCTSKDRNYTGGNGAYLKNKRVGVTGPTQEEIFRIDVRCSPNAPAREYGVMRDAGEHDDASRFVGSASGIHYIRAVHLRLARRSAARMSKPANNTLIPGEDDQLQKGASVKKTGDEFLWKANEVVLPGNEEGVPPSFEDYVEWSKSYFESWHPVLPFVHGPEILRLFEDACTNGFSSLGHENQAILKSILSISLADSRQGISPSKPIPHHVIFSTVDDALSSSKFALSRPASIRSTQAAFAIQLFLTSMLCLNAASRLGRLIVRGAFHLGLHRCPTRFSFFNPEQASVRRRVFWCIYTLERLLCQSLGLPLDIQDNDIDVCYIGEERHMHPGSDVEETGRLRLLTFVAKHARLRGLILELRNKSILQRQDTADRTVHVISGKDTLRHLAARDTWWPEYCLEAIDELLSTVKELPQRQAPSLESPIDDIVSSRVPMQPRPHHVIPTTIPQCRRDARPPKAGSL
ncbi:unnamed protein product [Parascedosporium putredinis]|uniref:Xylanolytic transcriptional activator regulatory domain-containing protein n=1 Tax=Parascedosporium putredinis TaxID=1442378 RepID=A0A9P1GXU3_9PEZI|nr:unnamed protein product [Parascedosporium putredinis]CAI7990995.1 unnamed protein product [Parascedosporium putredinis]